MGELRVVVNYPARHVEGKAYVQGRLGCNECILQVDPQRVRDCLGHLMEHNDLYKDVHFDNATMESLERERRAAEIVGLDDVFNDWDECDQRFTTTMNIDPVAPREVAGALGDQYGPARVVREGNAVRPHEVRNLLAQCFPSLFPNGTGANYRDYRVPLSTSEMLQHTMKFGDTRFTKHYRYLFMMVNVKNLDLGYKSISAALKGRITQKNFDGSVRDVTANMLAELSKVVCMVQAQQSLLTLLCRTLETARNWMS